MWFVLLDKAHPNELPYVSYEMLGPLPSYSEAARRGQQALMQRVGEYRSALIIESASEPLWYAQVDETRELFGPFLLDVAELFCDLWRQVNNTSITLLNAKDSAPLFRALKESSTKH